MQSHQAMVKQMGALIFFLHFSSIYIIQAAIVIPNAEATLHLSKN